MESTMAWLGPLKQFALVWFFLIFTAILFWTYSRGNQQLEELRNLPFDDGPGGPPSMKSDALEVHGRG